LYITGSGSSPLFLNYEVEKCEAIQVQSGKMMNIFYSFPKPIVFYRAGFDCIAKGTYPALQGVIKGMYPETNTLPKQHTSPFRARLLMKCRYPYVCGKRFEIQTF
jgi:hypothetical protein